MRSIVLPPARVDEVASEDRPSVNILVLYGDEVARDRAARIKEHLIGYLDGSIDMRFSWCSMELWFYPGLMKLPTETLKESDIVLFSIRPGGILPLAVKAWIAETLSCRDGHQCGLLALVEPEMDFAYSGHPSPARLFLGALARGCGLEFISQPPAGPPGKGNRRNQFSYPADGSRERKRRVNIMSSEKIE